MFLKHHLVFPVAFLPSFLVYLVGYHDQTHRALSDPRPPLLLAGLCSLETACLTPSRSLDPI